MAKAILDPDQLRNFANQLDQSRSELQTAHLDLLSAYSSLGEHWKDEKYQRFDNLFREATAHIKRYQQESEKYSNFLRQKAGRAQRYLDQR